MDINLLIVLLSLIFSFYVPGYFLSLIILKKGSLNLNHLEIFVIRILLSIPVLYSISIILNKFYTINRSSLISSIISFSLICYLLNLKLRKGGNTKKRIHVNKQSPKRYALYSFAFLLILILSILLRVEFLESRILPSSTDMAHHTYFAREIMIKGHIPSYPHPQFVVGEHLIIAVPAIIGDIDLISAFPLIILYLFNLFGLIIVYLLTESLFKTRFISLLAFFFMGLIYFIQRPGLVFVSGGVVGNVLGDSLILISIYFLYKTFEDNPNFFFLFVISSFTLVYIHTLSTIVLFYTTLFTLIMVAIFTKKELISLINALSKHGKIIYILLWVAIIMILYLPSYLYSPLSREVISIDKENLISRQSLSLDNYESILSELRLYLGLVGLFFLITDRNIGKRIKIIISCWIIPTFLLSWAPGLLLLNLPSERVTNYLVYPLTILSAFAIYHLSLLIKSTKLKISFLSLLLLFSFIVGTNGAIKEYGIDNPNFSGDMQLYHASTYLINKTTSNERVFTEHMNSGFADQWIKVFLMQGYDSVIYRTYPFRYEGDVSQDTWIMMTEPNSKKGLGYMDKNNVTYIVLNTKKMNKDFYNSQNYQLVYQNTLLSIFRKI